MCVFVRPLPPLEFPNLINTMSQQSAINGCLSPYYNLREWEERYVETLLGAEIEDFPGEGSGNHPPRSPLKEFCLFSDDDDGDVEDDDECGGYSSEEACAEAGGAESIGGGGARSGAGAGGGAAALSNSRSRHASGGSMVSSYGDRSGSSERRFGEGKRGGRNESSGDEGYGGRGGGGDVLGVDAMVESDSA